MTVREKKFLSDILYAIDAIETITQPVISFDEYKNNLLVKAATERFLGIVGEAVNQYLKVSAVNNLNNSSQIISLRNRLIHSYDNIDDRIIWTIIKKHLQPLKEEVEKLL